MKGAIKMLLVALSLPLLHQHSNAQVLVNESFDGTTFPPTGWSINSIYAAGTDGGGCGCTDWVRCTSYGGVEPPEPTHSGSGMAWYNSWDIYPGNESYLVTPTMNFSSFTGGSNSLDFWMYRSQDIYWSGYENDEVDVYIYSPSYGYYYLTTIYDGIYNSPSVSSEGWYEYNISLPSSFSSYSSVNVVFDGYSEYSVDMYIDDVNITHHVPCSGKPAAGVVLGPSHKCANTSFTVRDTSGSTTGVTGLAYQWQKRTTGTSAWSNISGATSTNYTTSITVSTDFRCYVNCTASGFTDTTPSLTVTKDTFYICYCAMPTTGTNIGGNPPPIVDSIGISSTTMHNATHAAFSGAYGQISDSVTQTQATVTRGGVYTLYVKYGGSTAYGMAWIDWNRDGVFQSSEYIALNSTLAGSVSASFTVPGNAALGKTGLRIRTSTVYSPSSSYACTNFGTGTGAGETADYLVTVKDTPIVDVGVVAINTPLPGVTYCPNKADTISVRVLNFGKTGASNFYVYAVVDGPSPITIYTYYTGTLAPLTSANVYVGTIDPPLGGLYSIKAYTVLAGDSINYNDSSYGFFNIYNFPSNANVHSDTVCPGGTAHISLAPVPATKYRWYRVPAGGSAFDSTSTSKSLIPVGDSVYFISATDSLTGCVSNRVPITAAARPAPLVDIGPDTTLCQTPYFFLDAGNPGAKYLWNTGDTTRTINPRVTGTYTVYVNHYCVVGDSAVVTINPLPQASGINYVRSGNTYSFGASGAMYVDHYKWYFGDGTTDTSAAPVHTYSTGGSYSVKLVLYNDCGTDTVGLGVPNKVININNGSGQLSIYPNPANNTITISSENAELKEIVIVNTVGSVVHSQNADNSKSITIDISQLPQGQYILRANTSMGYNSKLFDVIHQ